MSPPPEETGSLDNAVPEVIAGRYEVVRALGEDRLGRVFEVRDRQVDGRRVALKLFWSKFSFVPQFKDVFFRRVKVAQSITGEHVNRVLSSGMVGTQNLYVIMDLVEGETLRDRLRRENTLQPRQALEIARQLLIALSRGHEKNLFHEEVVPKNVMLANAVPKTGENPYGVHVYLLNLGIAELGGAEVAGPAETLYMAPEKAQGKHVDVRADLFSVGVIVCEMLLGSRLFQSELGDQIRQAALEGGTAKLETYLEEVSPSVRKIVLRALSKKRDGRFATADKFRRAIEASPDLLEPTRTPRIIKAAVVVILALGACGAWFGWRGNEKASTSDELLTQRAAEYEQEVRSHRATKDELSSVTSRREEDAQKLRQLEEQLAQALARSSGRAGSEADVKPEAYAARSFDALLKLIEERRLEPAELLGALVPKAGSIPGQHFLTSLLAAATALHETRQTSDDRVRRHFLEQARRSLADSQSRRQEFAKDAAAWLGYQPAGTRPPNRLERLNRVLADLDARVKTEESSLASAPSSEGRDDKAWVRIFTAGSDQDPAEAFQLAKSVDGTGTLDPRLLDLAEKYWGGLESRVTKGLELDREALSREKQLLNWTRLLDESSQARNWPVSGRICLVGYARRFFHEKDDGPFPWNEVFQASGDRQPEDWRRDFFLRAQMVQRRPWIHQSTEHVSVFLKKTGDGPVTFLSLRPSRPPSSNEHAIDVKVYDETGKPIAKQMIVVKQSEHRYELENGIRIDLLNDKAKIQRYDPDPRFLESTIPRETGVRSDQRRGYIDEVKKLRPVDRECLVFESGGRSIWVSPKLGLVRIVAGDNVQELLYSNITP